MASECIPNSNSEEQFVTISVSCAQAHELEFVTHELKIKEKIIRENDVRPLMPVLSDMSCLNN